MIASRKSALPVQDCCRLLGLSRSSFYRKERPVVEPDGLLDELAGLYPRFGYRRLASLLGQSPKRIRLKMQRAGLGVPKKARRVRTTFPVPVSAPNLFERPTGPGRVLASDFTYVPLESGFAYFAVTLDVFTRRVVGWSFSRKSDAALVLSALAQATCSPLQTGWIHHSDRGAQYASAAFREAVEKAKGQISFSTPARPEENAYAESFFSRYKDEVVRLRNPMNFADTREETKQFVQFYNEQRPHSSLGNLSPCQFERTMCVS